MHPAASLCDEPHKFELPAGTPSYMAPEVIHAGSGKGRYGFKCDNWSVACVAIEMATGKRPWTDQYDNYGAILYKVTFFFYFLFWHLPSTTGK